MNRPNKKDYLTTNQFEYDQMLNKYYDALETYIDILEKQLTLTDVVESFYCLNSRIYGESTKCLEQCLACKNKIPQQ